MKSVSNIKGLKDGTHRVMNHSRTLNTAISTPYNAFSKINTLRPCVINSVSGHQMDDQGTITSFFFETSVKGRCPTQGRPVDRISVSYIIMLTFTTTSYKLCSMMIYYGHHKI